MPYCRVIVDEVVTFIPYCPDQISDFSFLFWYSRRVSGVINGVTDGIVVILCRHSRGVNDVIVEGLVAS